MIYKLDVFCTHLISVEGIMQKFVGLGFVEIFHEDVALKRGFVVNMAPIKKV